MTWKTTEIGNVINVKSSKRIFASEYSDTGIPFYRSKEIGELSRNGNTKSDLFISIERYEFIKNKFGVPKKGDLLLTSVGSIGNTWIVDDREFYYKDGNLTQLECVDDISMKFIQYYFKTNLFWSSIKSNVTGTAYSALTITKIKKLQIPLPPLPVQQKIATILDTADALKQKDKALIAKYDELNQSLFLDMFGDLKENKKNYKVVTVGDVTALVKDGPHVSPKYSNSGIPILSTRNIRPSELILSEIKYVSESTYTKLTKRFCPQKDDVLLTKGGTTGYAKVVDFDWKFCIWVHLAALRPSKELIISKYLEAALNSHYCYIQSQKYTRGIANKDLGLTRLINIQLLLPPISLQNQFADRIQAIEQQKKQAQANLQKSEDLFNCLLQKAFKGELV